VSNAQKPRSSNFIRDIISADLAAGANDDRVATRFPPEPNGYLHIGHAKAICINFGMAQEFDGQCHLRFDDTNPAKEDTEYVDGIKRDVRWLGFDWKESLFFASDFFDQMYTLAEGLIRDGKAYVCLLSDDAFRELRGSVTEHGKDSPGRLFSVEENLDLFQRMKAGEFEDGHCVLRARADMTSPNMKMRDPPLYRIRKQTHHRTGDDWCIYPMYDYAHPLEDAIEGITHSLCSLEFQDNRELYDWVIDNTAVTTKPRQYEFARLNLTYTIMSKRKLRLLVENGHVSGWDDPRMPTLCGMRRLGVPAEAIRVFIDRIGVAKTNSVVDMANLESTIRDTLNTEAPRVMAILDPIKVIVDNFDQTEPDWLDASYWPHDIPKEGTRKVPFTRELYIERSDFEESPPKGFYRLAPGKEVRLRYGYLVTCTSVDKDENGVITTLHVNYDQSSRGGNASDGRKVKGTIHWVSASEGIRVDVNLYDRLFAVEEPDAGGNNFLDHLNPNSLKCIEAVVEPSLRDAPPESAWQFERNGYFVVDSSSERVTFNRTVSLKDSWGKKKESTPIPTPMKPTKRKDSVVASDGDRRARKRKGKGEAQAALHASDPALAARLSRYVNECGLSEKDATTLTSNRGVSDFFETALAAGGKAQSIANWVANAVQGVAKDVGYDALRFTGKDISELTQLIDEGVISSKGAKKVFAAMTESGDSPKDLVEQLGLAQISDPTAIQAMVDEVIANNPQQTEQFRAGNNKLFGFFVGQVIRVSEGRAEPTLVNQILRSTL
jgi:glutaminyl-tRNA synthetase